MFKINIAVVLMVVVTAAIYLFVATSTKDLVLVEVRNHSGGEHKSVQVYGLNERGEIGFLEDRDSKVLQLSTQDLYLTSALGFSGATTGDLFEPLVNNKESFIVVTINPGKSVVVDAREITLSERIESMMN